MTHPLLLVPSRLFGWAFFLPGLVFGSLAWAFFKVSLWADPRRGHVD
jgi:hypothetical protein